jgi:hypothetical protein
MEQKWNKNIFKCYCLVNGSVANTEGDNKLKELLSWEARLSRVCYGEILLIILKKISKTSTNLQMTKADKNSLSIYDRG